MALYAVIEGEDADTAQYADRLDDHLTDDEILYIDPETDLDDDLYDELTNCEAGIVLGSVEEDRRDRLQALGDDVPLVADQDYEEFLSFDYESEAVGLIADRLQGATAQYNSERLKEQVADADSIAILLHDTPDPDAIAAGVTVKQIADHYSVDADIYHGGRVNHQENRALVNKLDFDMESGSPDWEEYDSIALLDTAPGNISLLTNGDGGAFTNNDGDEVDLDVVIDHHQGWEGKEAYASFIDVREDWSSTSSIMYDHLNRLDIEPTEPVATALVHGIQSDTDRLDLAKDKVHPGDFEAMAALLEGADQSVLADIENTTKSVDTMETIAKAIRNRKRDGATLFSYVEEVDDEDAIAQAADELLDMEGIERSIVAGVTDDGARISSRNSGDQYDVGSLMNEKFGEDGELGEYDCTGGGHKDMAGANIPFDDLGLFSYTYEQGEANEDFHVNMENTLVDIFELSFD